MEAEKGYFCIGRELFIFFEKLEIVTGFVTGGVYNEAIKNGA